MGVISYNALFLFEEISEFVRNLVLILPVGSRYLLKKICFY
jgi:hypothetical protein